jgi:hypothetical protein
MPKITPRKKDDKEVIVRTTQKTKRDEPSDWWNAGSKKELAEKLLGTVGFLKEQNLYRYRQASVYSRLYGNMPLFGAVGTNLTKIGNSNQLPMDRPTMSVITSCVDTLISRITQGRPRPIFLTDNGDYKARNLAKQMNSFIAGELYQTKAYEKGPIMLRDASVLGSGVLKVIKGPDKKVGLERRLCTELLVDANDGIYGEPRQLYEIKLVDRSVLANAFPKYRSSIEKAEQAFPDTSGESGKTVSDQVMVAEGWRLPSGPGAGDGMHVIACSEGVIFDEEWKKDRFPFVFLHYSPRMLGFWGQGLAERQMGTQVEINKLLMTISASINLVGVPRVFVEDGSKVVKAQLNNQVGAIVTYRGTPPSYQVAPCVPAELYDQLQRLINYAYQQEGISQLSSSSQKPAGLTAAAALREYDDLQSDRFAALVRRYDNVFIDLAYQIIDTASDIAKEEGKYQTVYPNKDGTKEINLPDVKRLEDPFVIQCFDASSLPRDPAGRLQKVTEMMQAGIIDPQEGRRLLDYPDIQQVDKLANAGEERILKILDQIVEEGEFTPPDPFMDLDLANKLVTQYYNLYSAAKLEEKKAQLLRDFFSQIQDLKQQAMQALVPPPGAMPMPQGAPGSPMAVPQSRPVSDVLPVAGGSPA